MSATQQPKVSIIIVNRNGRKWLPNLLDSIRNQEYKNIEIFFVDNQSTDDSYSFVRQNYHEMIVIQNGGNFGFGKSANAGARAATGEFLIFLNEDMMLHKQMITNLLKCYTMHENVAIVVAKEVDYDDHKIVNTRGYLFDLLGNGRPNQKKHWTYSEKFFYAPGAPCFIKKTIFDILGGFEESFFLYYEDVDLSWKARLMGYNIFFCEDAIIYHKGAGTTNRQSDFTFFITRRNALYLLSKNYSLAILYFIIPLYFIQALLNSFFSVIFELNSRYIYIYPKVFLNVLRRLPELKIKRKLIQKKRVVNDFYIIRSMSPYYLGPFPLNLINQPIRLLIKMFKYEKK